MSDFTKSISSHDIARDEIEMPDEITLGTFKLSFILYLIIAIRRRSI